MPRCKKSASRALYTYHMPRYMILNTRHTGPLLQLRLATPLETAQIPCKTKR